MASVGERLQTLHEGSVVLRDRYDQLIEVERSKEGWTFFWNGEPGIRVESEDEALRWLQRLVPARLLRAAG